MRNFPVLDIGSAAGGIESVIFCVRVMICVGMCNAIQAKYPSPHIVMYKIADKLTQIQKVK
jgi:hypothetical protein